MADRRDLSSYAAATRAILAGAEHDAETGAIVPPIHLATTFVHPADASLSKGHIYQRSSNPTQDRVEVAIAALESEHPDCRALFFASGMAAVACVVAQFQRGDRILLADDCYFAARRLMEIEAERVGFSLERVDFGDDAAWRASLQTPATWVWLETPSNPRLKVTDIAAVAQCARRIGPSTRVVVDGTFTTAYLQQPLALGADLVMHSSTKYLAGHSDCMGGALVTTDAKLWQKLLETRTFLGGTASPFNAWLTLRGIRTLAARLQWQCKSAHALALALDQEAAIECVNYPGLPSHPGHSIAERQSRQSGLYGAMLSFELKASSPEQGRRRAIAVADKMRIFQNATSLGGFESLVEHRQSVEGVHSSAPPGLLRLSVGLEASEDLLADLRQAFVAAQTESAWH